MLNLIDIDVNSIIYRNKYNNPKYWETNIIRLSIGTEMLEQTVNQDLGPVVQN